MDVGPDLDTEGVDAAAADPPLVPLAGAVAGVLVAAAGLVGVLVGLLADPLVVPLVGSATAAGAVALVLGLVGFVASMLAWSPDVGSNP